MFNIFSKTRQYGKTAAGALSIANELKKGGTVIIAMMQDDFEDIRPLVEIAANALDAPIDCEPVYKRRPKRVIAYGLFDEPYTVDIVIEKKFFGFRLKKAK